MKTAMQELIEMIKKTMGNAIEEQGFDNACQPFLDKEQIQTKTAWKAGDTNGRIGIMKNEDEYFADTFSI